MIDKRSRRLAATKLSLSVAVVLVAMGSAPASAFRINVADPDVNFNWDTQLRYNLAWRMEDPNPHFLNAAGTDEIENNFKKHDLYMNRFDIFSEADYVVSRESHKYGARISASAWMENAYDKVSHPNPAIVGFTSNYGPSAQWSAYPKRFNTGSSGEISDAFVFGGMQWGAEQSADIKIGQHNVYWGESTFNSGDSVSHMQGPIDTIKSSASPGVEAKELFMPVNQISGVYSPSSRVTFMYLYTLDWKPYKLTGGGTYSASSDGSGNGFGPDTTCGTIQPAARGGCFASLPAITPGRDGGNFGLAVRVTNPFGLWGSAGLYYRKYDEKLPQARIQAGATGLGLRYVYARDTELIGASYSTRFGSISTAFEGSYRRNTALNSTTPLLPLAKEITPSYEQMELARGNTYHFLMSGTYVLPSSSGIWETGNMLAEVAYQRLDKVTKNPNLYNSVDYACRATRQDKSDGCSTRDFMAFAMSFNPQWMAVLPGVDLTVPISYSYGVFGNAPSNSGGNDGAYRWSVGLNVKYNVVYEFALTLSDQHQSYRTKTAVAGVDAAVPGAQIYAAGNGSSQVQNSHRWLNLRFKTSF